ncbi:sodium/phosphate symporter [Reticulomyxa filosa]|uniref:Sodium/phosphate symporter n=1 Tax=Reticulomyxa filosa TaxID=46433 RepID=X6NU15_RETFI|nr:sodium/phosphate symporter [Reticulomyxa filosa]|eukprot:ETO29790.1 sodium/phosphate symporter [Reticulomyxa filosa]
MEEINSRNEMQSENPMHEPFEKANLPATKSKVTYVFFVNLFRVLERVKKEALKGIEVDVHENLDEFEKAMIANCEKFDPKMERAFNWLQVCTASLAIFAHGSNDAANAVAPFAAMIALYESPHIAEKTQIPMYAMALGGFGMVIGLSTYGYNVIKAIGVRMVAMTSSRGYCIEMSSALVIIMASQFGLPASTTHAQVGATLGIGLLEYFRTGSQLHWREVVNWKLNIVLYAFFDKKTHFLKTECDQDEGCKLQNLQVAANDNKFAKFGCLKRRKTHDYSKEGFIF